ncbi:hypothetical protein EYF80_056112 [Liparis tanakae]|uniref:Uncharacterized protein n=1 Tax=Liparis tanakae TaxID=230148 RepID=A0A4Z2EXY3_9TELE|nr:hypothetical protein EYF80_056112 [Liparis tanakae]
MRPRLRPLTDTQAQVWSAVADPSSCPPPAGGLAVEILSLAPGAASTLRVLTFESRCSERADVPVDLQRGSLAVGGGGGVAYSGQPEVTMSPSEISSSTRPGVLMESGGVTREVVLSSPLFATEDPLLL